MVSLDVRGLTKSFSNADGNTNVLFRELGFRLESGQILGLAGPSGTGKSTLLRIIAGLEHQDSGELQFIDKGKATSKSRVAYMPQNSSLLPWLSAQQNVILPQLLTGVSLQGARSKASDILSELGLSESKNLKPYNLSGGMNQRVSFATAVSLDSAVVLLDEPTSALDSVNRGVVTEIVRERATANRRAFVISSHDSGFLKSVCNDILEIQNYKR